MMTLPAAAIWHDLECGGYTADLSLWRRLATERPGPVLEIGAGTGRVSLELARAGHSVTALDQDPDVLAVLSQRATSAGLEVRGVCTDARGFALGERFALILVPMQTIQLFDPGQRKAFLSSAAAHLRPGGRLAAAITEHFDLYDAAGADAARLPVPDVQEVDGTLYVSQPTAIRRAGEIVILERRRESVEPDGSRTVELHQDRLAALSAASLEQEGAAVGLRPAPRADIGATNDHVGSVVVMLDA